jgi:2-keto-4-pentenoate hydratase/2-oxohepta-3-ene-1,7-dioic acid hydratase in catechol pathway
MKLVRYSSNNGPKIDAVKRDGIVDLSGRIASIGDNMVELITRWSDLGGSVQQAVERSAPDIALGESRLLAPVARSGKVMGIGLNYADHISETGQETPRHQVWFTKAVTAINGPFDPIEIPRASPMVDYEAELVVVVGKRCRHVPKQSAAEVVFGYCVGNEV